MKGWIDKYFFDVGSEVSKVSIFCEIFFVIDNWFNKEIILIGKGSFYFWIVKYYVKVGI